MAIPRPRSLFARALLAFLALPGLVAFGVPLLLVWPFGRDVPFHPIGAVPFVVGTALLLWCIRDFYVAGKGTLAPWDPPRHLVVLGLYRRSRNPMYVAVGLVLLGWAVGFRSPAILFFGLAVMVAFHVRVVLGEEPWLARTHRKDWERYAARVPRWLFPSRKALLLTLLCVALSLPLVGLIYEAYADAKAAGEFPPPGMLVDVGGRRLHLICIGDGEPTVFFEASGFGVSSMSAADVRQRVAADTRVCSYDRMGMGWSDAGPSVVSVGMLARDLAVLQDRAELHGPFILVGSSIGGLTIEMFTRLYPERVVGLVFLDAANSIGLQRAASLGAFERFNPRFAIGRLSAPVAALAARVGLVRLIDPFDIPTDSETTRRSAALTYGARPIGTLAAIVRGGQTSLAEFEQAPPLPGDLRLAVLSAEERYPPPGLGSMADILASSRVEVHQQLAKRSTRGSWQMVPKSEHLLANSQPDVVTNVVLKMVADIRAN